MVTPVKGGGSRRYSREYFLAFPSLIDRMKLMALAQPPRLWAADSHGERRVTWMELFFDLIFVAAVALTPMPRMASQVEPEGVVQVQGRGNAQTRVEVLAK